MMNRLGIDADREYTLSCKVKSGRTGWLNGRNQQNESTLIFLIPEQSTEADFFLGKYLPSIAHTNVEMTADIARPVNRRIKLALCRESKEYPKGYYIHVMDPEAISILKTIVGKKVNVRVVSENEESQIVLNAGP